MELFDGKEVVWTPDFRMRISFHLLLEIKMSLKQGGPRPSTKHYQFFVTLRPIILPASHDLTYLNFAHAGIRNQRDQVERKPKRQTPAFGNWQWETLVPVQSRFLLPVYRFQLSIGRCFCTDRETEKISSWKNRKRDVENPYELEQHQKMANDESVPQRYIRFSFRVPRFFFCLVTYWFVSGVLVSLVNAQPTALFRRSRNQNTVWNSKSTVFERRKWLGDLNDIAVSKWPFDTPQQSWVQCLTSIIAYI